MDNKKVESKEWLKKPSQFSSINPPCFITVDAIGTSSLTTLQVADLLSWQTASAPPQIPNLQPANNCRNLCGWAERIYKDVTFTTWGAV